MSASSLSKKDLIELLDCAKTSAERNKAVKLLKRFDPVSNFSWDDEHGSKENLTVKEYKYVVAFLCPRCGKVKQANTKVFWQFFDDGKTTKKVICTGCYKQLLDKEEVRKLRTQHQKAKLVPSGMGFGLQN